MVAAVKAQAALRRELEFDEMVGTGLQDDIREEIEREVAEHQAANMNEVVNTGLVDDVMDQTARISRIDADLEGIQESSAIPSTTEGTLVETNAGSSDLQSSQKSFVWDRDTF